ncbi:hypothetical protein OWR29_39165 [Actinoplanes sp. Pm04-4]|uniref:Uncharacterized protein n=1 Tax=Paractinoplanes pyxinae TaxID=2997416 RepID=A0ABT4BC08_9ACTN|nr:hypothetical protein [Actinoplanes pyxinae]MCY1144052.1 hypothetical protein [Actinoplanes pyxinae]
MTGLPPAPRGPADPLEQIRHTILADPQHAVAYLNAHAGTLPWPAAVTHTLLAEAHLLDGNPERALGHAVHAASLPGTALAQALPACAVLADLNCWTGQDDAAEVCSMYRDLAGDADDPARLVCAQALHAVAVFQHQACLRGRAALDDLVRAAPAGSAVLVMLRHAQTAMADSCRTGTDPAGPSAWTPVPGGYLCPAGQPQPDYLTSRLGRHHATHICRDERPGPHTAPREVPR